MTTTNFDPETYTLGAELDRLDARADELADKLANADAGTEGAAMLTREARDVNQSGQAVAALVAEYGEDAEVTLRALNAGRYARVEDRIDGQGGPGSTRNIYVAEGLVSAPFYDGDPEDFKAKLDAVAGQSPGVAVWLEDRITDLGANDRGNWQPLDERLAAKATD